MSYRTYFMLKCTSNFANNLTRVEKPHPLEKILLLHR